MGERTESAQSRNKIIEKAVNLYFDFFNSIQVEQMKDNHLSQSCPKGTVTARMWCL